MAIIKIDLKKSVEENASDYFEKAKKIKKKVEGAQKALDESRAKLAALVREKEKQESKKLSEEKSRQNARKIEWYEKFRWFVSSEGFLAIGGRDATSNEIVIKKHAENKDLVFHTDMAGSPFFVVKSEGRQISEKTMQECADATCTFSRAWKIGLQNCDVFYTTPENVSKKTKAGEYMGKGAFMIYGKANYISNRVNLAIGINDNGQVMSGPLDSIKAHCKKYVVLVQGQKKVSAIAKYVQHKIGGTLDEIIRALPSGGFEASKNQN